MQIEVRDCRQKLRVLKTQVRDLNQIYKAYVTDSWTFFRTVLKPAFYQSSLDGIEVKLRPVIRTRSKFGINILVEIINTGT